MRSAPGSSHRLKLTLIWLAISLLAGAGAYYLFELNFWLSALIAGLALIANGVLADREDRGTFTD